jgi:hypothetical protein
MEALVCATAMPGDSPPVAVLTRFDPLRLHLWFKDDLLAVIEGEGKVSQDALANKRLVT